VKLRMYKVIVLPDAKSEETMKQAFKKSIQKWQKIKTIIQNNDVPINFTDNSCSLCATSGSLCNLCPIYFKTLDTRCHETPYRNCAKSFYDLHYLIDAMKTRKKYYVLHFRDGNEFKERIKKSLKCVDEELKFLTDLYKECYGEEYTFENEKVYQKVSKKTHDLKS